MKMHSPGALLGGLDHGVLEVGGHGGHAGRAARLALDVGALLDIGQTVVEQGEHRGRDLLAEAVAGAEILVDPDLHQLRHSYVCCGPRSASPAVRPVSPLVGVRRPATTARPDRGPTPLTSMLSATAEPRG